MRSFAIACLAAVIGSTPALAQKVGQTLDVGGWKLASDLNKDGSTGCSATFVYPDKSIIAFTLDNDDVHMFIVSEPSAKMTAGSQARLSYRIDNGRSFNGVGIAASATMLAVPIAEADLDPIYGAFQRGNSLFIRLGDQEFEEPLDGSSNAISALSTCQDGLPSRKK